MDVWASRKQSERLRFIDFRLLFCGFLNRSDLMKQFDIAQAAASRDLKAYRDAAPDNLIYDKQNKSYIASKTNEPIFEHDPFQALSFFSAQNATSSIERPLIKCEIPVELDTLRLDIVAQLTQAIAQRRALAITYFSMSSGKKERVIAPHCLVHNGLRWHVRAYDRLRKQFIDLVISRIREAQLSEKVADISHESQQEDRQWNRFLELEIVPHPKLRKKEVVRSEYQMIDGCLKIEVRAAVAGYLLRRWNIDCSAKHSLKGGEYHLWLRNRAALYGVDNLVIAPGYVEAEGDKQ